MRITIFSCDSTREASSLSRHSTDSAPTRSPYRLRLFEKEVETKKFAHRLDVDYVGSVMPPPEAVKEGKVAALSDEDRRTLTRWIDLGCPVDLDYDPKQPEKDK